MSSVKPQGLSMDNRAGLMKATAEEAMAITSVFWDVKAFPVPPGFDARRVGLCIKRLLEKHGYYGPLTINAVGLLTDVHEEILGALSSAGINLYYGPYESTNILMLMLDWVSKNGAPSNMLGICNRTGFFPRMREFNLFGPFSFSSSFAQEASSWKSLILEISESEEVGEDKCSEAGECFCLICNDYPPGQGFESFTRHLSSLEHAIRKLDLLYLAKFNKDDESPPTNIVRFQPKKATPEEAVAVTWVFWDMKTFPVPLGFDARLVGPCIKRFLEKYGYFGPLNINAVGILTDLPDAILGGLSSTGVNFYHALHGSTDITSLMSRCISKNPPPANILGLCHPTAFSLPLTGYNIFRPFSYSSPQQDAFLWETSLLADTDALEEDSCTESCGFICLGFESYTTLLSSQNI